MEDYYNAIAKAYNSLHKNEQAKKLEIISEHWNSKGLILDLACGTNIANNYFSNIIGLDKSIKMLSHGINVCAKAENLPFKNKAFDAVLCLTAFHNFDDPEKAIKEIKRILKKDCIAISIMKKSANFEMLKNLILKNFKVKIIEEEKDIIFTSP